MAQRKKDVDSTDLAMRVHALSWSLTGSAVGGLMMVWASVMGADFSPVPGWLAILGGFVGGYLFAYFVSTRLTQSTADVIGGIYAPAGSSTPPVREYSRARALAMQGQYEKAAAAWEIHVAEYPEDPVPYMELGRLYRNEINDYEESVKWYRRGAEDSKMSTGQLLLATQEIIEIYIHKLDQPRKAIPYLADFVARFPEGPNAEKAKIQLKELRASIREEDET